MATNHKLNIQGKKYDFKIKAGGECFYIKVKHKSTGRFSCINNLNTILSGLGVDMYNDDKYQDSWWILPKNKARKFGKIAKEILFDKKFRDYLEEKLDEDRKCGEWENYE